MRGTMKAGVLMSLMLLPALTRPTLAASRTVGLPFTGINSDATFPVNVDPICGIQITVHGSKPGNFYSGLRMPSNWLPPQIVEYPAGTWTLTYGNTGRKEDCFSRSDPRWWECGVFKGVHFGFYTDDHVISLLNPDPSVWNHAGPPCVYFGPGGTTFPCTGLTSHGYNGLGQVAIFNATPSSSAAATLVKDGGQSLSIRNVRIAVVADAVAINNLGPCALRDLAWQDVQLADSVLPPSTPEGGVGTLSVQIPDDVLAKSGWAVMVYDVTDPETGSVLTTSTLDFSLGK